MANLYLWFLLLLTTSCSVARANICSTLNATLENDATDNHSPKTNTPPISCCEAASKGECNDNLERYFHDPIAGHCERFIYSGCGGNSNRYSTKEDCEAACRDPCTLPVSTISCHESDFYYNQTIDACLQFATGMCSSNHDNNNSSSSSSHQDHNNSSNSFSSQEQCEFRCVKYVCHLQPVPYKNGSNKIYYDSKTGSCKEFNEGCRRNGNCFATVKDCQDKCTTKDAKCTMPKEGGFPCNHTTDANHFYYDAQNNQCKKYSKGKCAATVNNFLTLSQCSWTCEENVCMEGSISSFCNTSESRYFYNLRTRECEIFPKANCSENSFESKEQCQTKCLLKDICRIPVTPRDSCNGSESRWYFESKTGRCEEISHGGCDGNDNHFLSKASCEKGCSLNPCQSPTHPETCGKPQPGYYYDSKSGTCVFSNSFCYDDGNHFLSAELCEQTCIVANPCLAPVKEKSCESTQTRYYYDSRSGQCARFEFKGCGGNTNNYESLEECNVVCKDQQEKSTTGIKHNKKVNSTGDSVKHGNTSTESVGHNPNRKLVLIDNGLTLDKHANSNFNQTLQNDEPTEDDVYKKADPNQNGYRCLLPLKVGSCDKTSKRFYFDSISQTCRKFTYSGCDGNANTFLTRKQCVRACVAICYDPIETTPCSTIATHYYYNITTGMCEQQTYTGCGGSLNNFKELDTCERICVTDICTQRKKPGPCRGSIPRIYYDAKIGRCLPFTYGGCHQNGNNFLTMEDCQRRCIPLNRCTMAENDNICSVSPRADRFYFDAISGKCQPTNNNPCNSHANNFKSLRQCESHCKPPDPCVSPAKTSCGEAQKFTRFYYNKTKGVCEKHLTCALDGFESLSSCDVKCPVNICILPSEHGPCDLDHVRYYYSPESKKCRPFIYGGCKGNKNNFITFKECVSKCQLETCNQPNKTGSCGQRFERYFYDSKTNSCLPFIYTGCEGNSNNFPTLSACQNFCGQENCQQFPNKSMACNACQLKPKAKDCAHFSGRLHFYYNSSVGRCQKYDMGKCGSPDGNSFNSLDECEKACDVDVCQLSPVSTHCNATRDGNFFYDAKTDACKSFDKGFCGANLNGFSDVLQCERKCVRNICYMSKDTGPCKGNQKRVFYNRLTGDCEPFYYGGCKGNENNFLTIQDCEKICVKDPCKLPREEGVCNAYMPRFYYNSKIGECQKFIYGGCGGNENRFETIEACQKKCQADPCSLPPDTGHCEAIFHRFFYDIAMGTCREFIYGGCGGNENRFETIEACEKKCKPDPCSLPYDMGPCKAIHDRFYYDTTLGKCTEFTYGGCRGNKNNFKTIRDCQQMCIKDPCEQPRIIGPCKAKMERFYFNPNAGQCENFYYGGCEANENNFFTKPDCEKKCVKDPCKLTKETGPCEAYMPHYYYNSKTGQCEQFIYGGCDGNENRFETIEACEKKCRPDPCNLQPDVGPCEAIFHRFYYDATLGKCSKFIYGGCKGNKNNFKTIKECKKTCIKDPCEQPPKVGPCEAKIQRFYFNPIDGQCETFYYGGCEANKNNFVTRQDCEKRCVKDTCKLSKDTGPCEAYMPHYYHNSNTNECEQFIYGGCYGNENRFETFEACQKKCNPDPCSLSPDTGPCEAIHHRFYYDSILGECLKFIYGGCKGNKNNFKTIQDCQQTCIKEPCEEPQKVGPCKAKMERFYFNSMAGKCESFYYGGCKANTNNFFTIHDCEKKCVKDPCKLSKDSGVCLEYFRHYYYNSKTGQCEQFTYGGCGGNENHFETIEACEKKCRPDPCSLPPDAGPCVAHNLRFYYNSTLGKCTEFIYGGCEGNKNNFKTIRDCQQMCVKDPCKQPRKVGPCKAKMERFGFNPLSGECESFYYGGCDANENNFFTKQDCEKRCVKDPCKLSKETGLCKAYMPRYYYNSNTSQCEKFIYGGCGGNENRFVTIEACQEKCKLEPCELPPDVGPCIAIHPRFYYNTTLGKCTEFLYGGCMGNKNNFKTIKDCQQMCLKDPCEQPRKVGPCKAKMERFYFNSAIDKCESFYYGGCDANRNNFQTIEECQKQCARDPCSLRPDAGSCHDNSARFYFDLDTGSCLGFTYTGCGGNANRFVSVEQCEQTCIHNRCEKEMDPGVCDKNLTRFFYDSKRDQCVSFLYGGCGGNSNNFKSAKLCRDTCLSKSPCLQPLMPGPCLGLFLRYYYDSNQKRCVEFTYGGCHGNKNNFETLSDCLHRCANSGSKRTDKCHLPSDRGHCYTPEERFYYNPTLESCETFSYNGCAGNANNFLSEGHCDRECKYDPCKQPKIVGNCSGREKRWFFDETSQLCRAFNYSGCGGSDNNFHSIEQCEELCVKPPCRLEMATGSCGHNLPRFYYNWKHGRCYQFNYTGCSGNENRFPSMKKCQETCEVDPCLQPLSFIGQCSEQKKYFYNREFGICQAFMFNGCKPNGNIFSSAEECHNSCRHMYEIDLAR